MKGSATVVGQADSALTPLNPVLIALLLLAVFASALFVRGALLWPKTAALIESPYDDEGVYAAAAQLLVQGKLPYRDFFYGHPPAGALAFAPAVLYHFTPWGSPTSFLNARYLALVYSALTVTLGLAVGIRLWGVGGGVLSALLLAVDPQSVWTGRHVMLEAPLLLLMAGAAWAYVVALGRTGSGAGWLLVAGLCGGLAGAVKLPGLLILAAITIDLLARKRWVAAWMVAMGAALAWLPVAVYIVWQRASDPLGQFLWFQLLRPGDGVRGAWPRMLSLVEAAPLTVLAGLLALATLFVAKRTRVGGADAVPTSGGTEPSGAAPVYERSPTRHPEGLETRRVEWGTVPERRASRWSFLGWWLLLATVLLFLSRSYYLHYATLMTLPLALVAGALPERLARLLHADSRRPRAVPWLALLLAGPALLAFAMTVRADFTSRPDAMYQLVGRYAGDAAKPGQTVFALDAQFPFRAARPPAREAQGRYIVDGYGSLLYTGLGIAGSSTADLARRLIGPPLAADPYAVMWRPTVQAVVRAAIERSAVVVIDAKSDGRLTDETRRWLATRGTLVERQERYAIYRIER